jgi:A/G-specific adenine glycosylase
MDVFEADMPPHEAEVRAEVKSAAGIISDTLGRVAEPITEYGGTEAECTTMAADTVGSTELPAGYAWIGPEAMDRLAFPNLFLKLLQQHWGIRGRGEKK